MEPERTAIDLDNQRLQALDEYRILGTDPEQCYDDITQIASLTCGTPIALMSLVDADRQWFKSKVGIDARETPRDWSFCSHAIKSDRPMVVEDALHDERFSQNPLVTGEPHIRLYAGFPLKTPEDQRIGTLCVIDREPHTLTDIQMQVMQALSRQVVVLLELRKRSLRLIEAVSQFHGKGNMLPTCSWCKEVRDGSGEWQHLETYMRRHTKIRFSHGICDKCMETHFPDVVEAISSDDPPERL